MESGQGGPGDTGQFPVQGGPGDTGQFPVHGGQSGQSGQSGQGGTGRFPMESGQGGPGDTGQFPVQGGQGAPGDTGQFPVLGSQGGPGDTGQFPAPGVPAPQFQRPGTSRPGGPPSGAGPEGGPMYPARPQGGQQYDLTAGHGSVPAGYGQGGLEQQQQSAEPMALPPAPTRGDEPTPIFAAIESDWFRTGQAERMQQIHVEQGNRGPQAPPPRPVGRTAPPQRRPGPGAQRPMATGPTGPQPAATAQPASPAPVAQPLPRETPNWRTSPNDELRQRAEAIRQPAAGGVTPSGLPRRVPRANLVAGGATQQQAPQGGPQISRAPDDVRGRLTNLRRGIQQGRQAGNNTDGRGIGMNNQER